MTATETRSHQEVALAIADGVQERLESLLYAPEENEPIVMAQYDDGQWLLYAATGKREVAIKVPREKFSDATDKQIEMAIESLEGQLNSGQKAEL